MGRNHNLNLPLIEIEGFKLSFPLMWIRDDTPFLGKIAEGVVLLVPVYNTTKRCWKVWERAIERLDPAPEKVIFCENNSSDETLDVINKCKFPHEVIRVWFKSDAAKGQPYEPIANVRQLLLTRARQLNVKMAIFLDDDCIPERKDFIQMFLNNNLDICGGTYTRDFPEGFLVASKWSVDMPIEEMPKGTIPSVRLGLEKSVKNAKERKMPMLTFAYQDFEEGKLYKCSVTSGGALALSQKLIQDRRISFVPLRHDLTSTGEVSEDFGFCLLAGTLGYIVHLDFRIKFAHLGARSNTSIKDRPWVVDQSFSF